MNLNEMCKNACKLLEEDGFHGLYLILDIGDSLVFYGGNPEEVYYGVRSVSVHKETGETNWYAAHQHEDVVDNATEIDVPKEFKYKAS
jgi:hypothetical protein